jgi:hypothetical protein
MHIIQSRKIINSVDEMESIVSASRLVIIYEVIQGLQVHYEVMIVNRSIEKGGMNTSLFVGGSGKFANIDFIYRGEVIGNPFIDRQNLKLNLDTIISVKVSSFSYMTSAQRRRDILFSSSLQDSVCGDFPTYATGEEMFAPGPQFYTESHRISTGNDRFDFASLLMNDCGDFITTLRDLVDENTKFKFCTINDDEWIGLLTVNRDDFMEGILAQITTIQHAALVAFVDELVLIMDTEDGFRPTVINSSIHPLTASTRGDDGYVMFFMMLEEAYDRIREIPQIPTRFFLRIGPDATHLRISVKQDHESQSVSKTRSKSDLIFYDFDNYSTL